MTIEQKLFSLQARKNTLEARGSHNKALVNKAGRQIRKYKKLLEQENK